jgi:glycosyltransferase involved in cell wall biosynthesis
MVKNKHVLLIVENNTVPLDVRVWSEANALKESGYEVSIICPEDRRTFNKEKIINGINIYRHPQPIEGTSKTGLILEYLNSLVWEFLLCIKIFFKKRFHVIHSANPPDHIFLIALLFKLFGVKYVFDHHDIAPENYVAKFEKKGILFYLLLLMEWLTFKTADIVVSTNESYKKIAIQRGGKREKDVFVVRNGPDLDKIRPVEPDNKLRDGFKYLVGYVGTIGQQEEIENLLDIAKYIIEKKNIFNIKFIVVGTGPYWEEIVKISTQMGLERFVNFTGYVPDEELYEILSTVDVCVNPEFANEFTDKSTMIKIMEYMVFGKPIVQFETTEGKITAGESSAYIKKNNIFQFALALIDLLENKQKRIGMGKKGQERVIKVLQWKIQKINLLNAYERLEQKQKPM